MKKSRVARAHFLDWLRVVGILAVLVYHSSRFFNVEDWHVKNPVWIPWVEVWNRFAVIWLMPLMFVISGLLAVIVSGLAYLNPHIRDVEQELPDAIPG